MAEKVSRQTGKIVYVEPNNFISERMNEKFGSTNIENIPPDHEDYSIYVDLQVEVVSRNACGQNITNPGRDGEVNEGTIIKKLSWTPRDNKISFMGGTKLAGETTNMFTTDYLNTSFNDISGGTANNEALGISSINIDFTNWFFPVVVIKFTDVRGASLMGPEDYSHTEAGEKHAGSFFKSFFTFPYPKFTLTVKGFYGQPVSFLLATSDFRADFSSQTGNFDVTVKFIGYMYGLLTDVSMKYLIAAPYDKYAGAEYWKNKKFVFDDGTPMITFIEFLERVRKLNEDLQKYANDSDVMNQYTTLRNEIQAIDDILYLYRTFIDTINNGEGGRITGDRHILFTSNNQTIGFNKDYRTALYSKISDYNNHYKAQIPLPNKDKGEETGYTAYELFKFENNVVSKITGFESELSVLGWEKPFFNDAKLMESVERYTTEPGNRNTKNPFKTKYAFLYEADGFIQDLTTRKETKSANLKKLTESVDEFQRATTKSAVGFVPSIANITKMTLAHFETFMAMLYQCMGSIKEGGRTLGSLGIPPDRTDTNVNVTADTFVPPFPLYTEENVGESRGQTVTWVGDKPSGDEMEEVDLIHGILEGIKDTKKLQDEIQAAMLQNTVAPIDFIPTCLTDINYTTNPYKEIFKGSESNLKIDELYSHFALRLTNYITNDVKKRDKYIENFAKAEAYNFFKTHPQEDTDLINKLKAPENGSGTNVVEFLTRKSIPNGWGGLNGGVPIYKTPITADAMFTSGDTNVQYNWVRRNKNGIKMLPVKFDNIRSIDTGVTTNFYLPSDTGNEINHNIFKIDPDVVKYQNILSIVANSELPGNIDKDYLLKNWDITIDSYKKNYPNYYISGTDAYQFIVKKLLSDLEIKEGGNILPEQFRTANERNSSDVKNIFKIEKIKEPNTFYVGEGSGTIKSMVKRFCNGELSLNDLFYSNINCGRKGSLYGHPFFYLQNSIDNSDTRLKAKALLFLHSLPVVESGAMKNVCQKLFLDNSISESIITRVPISSILFLGGLLWREWYYNGPGNNNDCFRYNLSTTENKIENVVYNSPVDVGLTPYLYLLTNNSYLNPPKKNKKELKKGDFKEIESFLGFNIFGLRPAIKNVLIRAFETWADINNTNDYSFSTINTDYELRFKNSGNISADKLVAFIKAISEYYHPNGTRNDKIPVKTLTDNFIFGETLEDFYRENISDNLPRNYMTMGLSDGDDAFFLQCRQSTIANQKLLDIALRDIIVMTIDKSSVLRESNNNMDVNRDQLRKSIEMFRQTLLDYYKQSESDKKKSEQGEQNPENNDIPSSASKDMRLSAYLELKNLYDRWLCSNEMYNWEIDDPKGLYSNFVFIDSFYESIGHRLMLSLNSIVKNLDTYHSQQSLYEFLSAIYQESNVLFLATPIYNNWKTSETIEKMFTPIPFHEMELPKTNSSTFICLYAHEPSKQLDLDNVGSEYGYRKDNFDIADSNGNITNELLSLSQLGTIQPTYYICQDNKWVIYNSEPGYPVTMYDSLAQFTDSMYEGLIIGINTLKIPAFGVTIGKQNQSFFQNFSVTMDNPQVTEQSIAAVQEIANDNSSEPNRQISYVGQDLYKVYSNHSYTCNLDMMGCAPILPLMYFQLNNVNMFKGAYMIKGVSHTIVPGNMTTSFSGMRLSKYNIPMLTEIFNVNDLLSQTSDNSIIKSSDLTIDGDVDMRNSRGMVNINNPDTSSNAPTYNEMSQYVVFTDFSTSEGYDMLDDSIKNLLYRIAKTVDSQTEYKVAVSSMGRLPKGDSDHSYYTNDSLLQNSETNSLRKSLHKYKACAVDVNGCIKSYKKGDSEKDKKLYSAALYDLIALNFTNEIRQLIWEDKGGGEAQYRDEFVHNVIHLSTYGTNIQNNAKQFFQSPNKDGQSLFINDDVNFMPLSSNFLSTLAELVSNPNKYPNITMNNFNNFRNAGYTDEKYKNRLSEMKIIRKDKFIPPNFYFPQLFQT
jgi:hypothetical protein